jgi:23S rRNA (cytidine1920-2'-O)/16S rRNA (cytidine1409-2'-O)-methyltransferase
MSKQRLDVLLAARGLFDSRERARAAVMEGSVYVNGQKADKPGTGIGPDAAIEVRGKANPYVSRGGLKLEKALCEFSIDVTGLNVLDGGASTGGFTHCLLKHGAARVFAVDVGYGQLAWELRNDERVTLLERFNLRYITAAHLGGVLADMATLDLSFISLSPVLPAVNAVLKVGSAAVCLIKPQFEAGRDKVGKGGVVRGVGNHREVLNAHIKAAEAAGFGVKELSFSPIKGPKGNIEYLSHLVSGLKSEVNGETAGKIIEKAHEELS